MYHVIFDVDQVQRFIPDDARVVADMAQYLRSSNVGLASRSKRVTAGFASQQSYQNRHITHTINSTTPLVCPGIVFVFGNIWRLVKPVLRRAHWLDAA